MTQRRPVTPPASAASEETLRPLEGVVVLEIEGGLAVRYCGKLLADAGARVITLAVPGSAPELSLPYADDWREFVGLGKEAADFAADAAQPREELLARCDLLLTGVQHASLAAWGLDCETALERHEGLVAACVSPFGQTGPYAGLAADDVVISALCGLSDATPGFPDHRALVEEAPVQSLAPLAELGAGVLAAAAITGPLVKHVRGEAGPRHIEVASIETGAAMMVWEWGMTAYGGGVRGRRPQRADLAPNCYLPCRDGGVVLIAFTEAHWVALTDMMGMPELRLDPDFADPVSRSRNWERLEPVLGRWAAEQPGLAVLEAAQARGLPCCCSFELADTVASEQVRSTGSLHEASGRAFPTNPITADGIRHTAVSGSRREPAARTAKTSASGAGADAGRRPLAGIKVVDLGQAVAAPFAGQILSALGAEVILVEPPGIPVSRRFEPVAGEPGYDASYMFNQVNRGKSSAQLDLMSESGYADFCELVRDADVVIENFSARAVEKLRIEYDDLRSLRDDIVLASVSGLGRSGPWGNYVALHSGAILLSGLASVTRDEDDRMRMVGSIFPDLLTGAFVALGIQQALAARDDGQGGRHISISMLDVLLNSMGGLIPSAARGARFGRHPAAFVPLDEGAEFVVVPEPTADALDVAAKASPGGSILDLHDAGVFASPVLSIDRVMADPHLNARGFTTRDNHPVVGDVPVPAVPWLFDGERPHLDHAPLLGNATAEVVGRSRERTAP